MDTNVRSLRDVRKRSSEDDKQHGPPSCRVRVVGDPEIFDSEGNYHHYFGPALLVNLDNRGMVRSLEFVGVRRDNDYISEVWQLDVRTQKYKYRDLSQTQGINSHMRQISTARGIHNPDEPQFKAGDASWASEAPIGAVPPKSFLQKFSPENETFFVDCRSGMFMRGPRYGLLKGALEHAPKLLKPLFKSCSMDADAWMQQAADAIAAQPAPPTHGAFPMPCREAQAVQVAQLVYGLASCVVVPSCA